MPLFRQSEANASSRQVDDGDRDHSARETARKKKQAESHTPVLLLIVVLASLATVLCYRVFLGKYDEGLHNSVVEHLQKLFPEAHVQVGRVAADGPDRIIVNNVRLAGQRDREKRSIVTIHRAILHGDLDISHWAQKTTCVKQADLYGVRVDAWPAADGSWPLRHLNPHPVPNAEPPEMTLHDATICLYQDASPEAVAIALHGIQGRVKPMQNGRLGAGSKPPLHVELSCRSTGLLRQLKLDGQFDPNSNAWSATGSIADLDFSRKLLEALPPQLSQYLSQLAGLECQATSQFKVSSSASRTVDFDFQGTITGGRLRDPRLPYPLEELRSDFFCNNQMLQLRSMRAKSGGAELDLSSDIMGFGREVPMVIHARAKNLELDSRLRESLPDSLQELWDRLQPAGHVSGTIELSFDGNTWTPVAFIQCENVSLEPWLFPFPLTAIHGQVRYQAGNVSSEQLDGLAGGQPVQSSFSLSRQGEEWFGKISGKSKGPIAIDDQLLAALTPRDRVTTGGETFVRSLNPRGSIELTKAVFERASPTDPIWHRTIDANVYGGSIQYDHFRYPIYDIRGRIAGQDDIWWLHQFEGRNDSGRIFCSGNWRSPEGELPPFDLRFDATAVPIEEELQKALPADAQFIWDELRPAGSIDRLQVQLVRRIDEPLTTRVLIEEESASNQVSGRALRIHPRSFPLPLTDIDCSIAYEPGHVVLHSASGVNRDSRLSIRGDCQPQADGRWRANVQWQPRTRLIVDGQLLRALPKSIRDSLVRVDFRGPVSVLGESQIVFPNRAASSPETSWDCQLDVENGQLGDGKNIGALRGTVSIRGDSDGTNLNAAGSLTMDALTVQGIPVSRLKGPFAVQDNVLYFGTKVAEELGHLPLEGQPAEMTADALAGKLSLSGIGLLDSGKFFMDATLHSADLSTLLRELGVDRASTQAECDARINFSGIPWNSQTWAGDGDIRLTNAKLFQLPFMMRLMRTASVNAEDDSAFQTADIHFDIDGDLIPLRIQCDGDVLRLRGEGWTNLRRDIDLELYTYVGRRPIYNVVSPLLSESRYATFLMIEVSGTLDNPVMQRRPFPQIEATLQQIFPEVVPPQSEGSLLPWR